MSIWQDVYGDTSQALILSVKSRILMCIITVTRGQQLSKKVIAEKTGIHRSRIKSMMQGYLSYFTIEELLTVAHILGAVSADTPAFFWSNNEHV